MNELERLRARLQTGYFAPRNNDARAAGFLKEGRKKAGTRIVAVLTSDGFDDAADLPRTNALELNSLRWTDCLRRVHAEDASAMQCWDEIVMAWAGSAAAQEHSSVAWAPLSLEQRAQTLALGVGPQSRARTLLDQHIAALTRLEGDAEHHEDVLRRLRIKLTLMVARGDEPDALQDAVRQAVSRTFSASGYAVAEDLAGVADARTVWRDLLGDVGVPDDESRQRIDAHAFWLHATAPNGQLMPMGGRLPGAVPGAEQSDAQYIATGGAAGSPPSQIRLVDPQGLITTRSGWGETENDLIGETCFSMICGPVRGREAHQDVGRITYFSQGRPWLIDPVDAVDVSASGHSVVSVQDVRYRIHGGADLVRRYADEQVEGYRANLSVHLPVQWQRQAIFARTGNYLLIEDLVRSSTSFSAHQEWIIAPDVEVTRTQTGFLLSAEDKQIALTVSSRHIDDYIIDDLRDAAGTVVARRIRIPMRGSSARAVCVIGDVLHGKPFDVRRVPVAGKNIVIDAVLGSLRERLVVTPELSGVFSADTPSEDAVAQLEQRAVAGELTPDEQLAQRLEIRRAICKAKKEIADAGGGQEARRVAIRHLLEAGVRSRIGGLRDHGYAAALIDIAGQDLLDDVKDVAAVRAARRTALVDWPGTNLVQPHYGVRVRTTESSDAVPSALREPEIWSVDHGQLVMSTYMVDRPGDVLTVYFHGATDRAKFSMPRYERMRSMSELGLGPVMFFSDASLDLDSRMILSWYVGTEDLDLHREIAHMICAYAEHKGIDKVLLVGNSGGGFAALQIGAYLEGARVVSFNPQIRVDDYAPRIADTAHWALYGRQTVSDDPIHAPRMDLIERYRRIGFAQDVELIQNPGDDHHYKEHFLPFCAAFENSGNGHRLLQHTPFLGPGHRVPPADEYLDYVRRAAAREVGAEWRLRGLRDGSRQPG